jgi:predicted RNA-binding Zn ribbon-like protein
MFKLDDNLLQELGLGTLPPVEKNRMLQHIYETLEMRVGMKLAEQMSNDQLDEFEGFIDRQDEAGALKWLETNFPNYKQVVADELEALKVEIKASAAQILAISQQAQAAAGGPAPAAPSAPAA